jgi:PAS domain S-box-containing protein
LGKRCNGQNVLSRPESADLRRLIGLAGRIFQVPVAYAAMLGHHDRVMSRIGSGQAYWKYLMTFPLRQVLASPLVVRDVRDGLPEGTDLGDLQFAASAPINTPCAQNFGALVIADLLPRPEFSDPDLETLVNLASAVANQIELRVIASQLMESELERDEAEERFRKMANSASTLIACNEADGSCEFVNDAWLRFTGRHIQNELGDGWQQVMHPRYMESALNLYFQALQTRQSFTMEVPLRDRFGVFRWMRGIGTPRLRKDSFAGFIICLTEVSDYIETIAASRPCAF